ncbi:MAG TPA: non-canonical purine NTP pyrophosphatase [Thermoanaerobaculia bacterium]
MKPPPVFVTGRPEKAAEAGRLGYQLESIPLDLAELQALDPGDVVEAKARAAYERLSRPVIVEDSGLEIHVWHRFPGALVKWLERSAGVEALARMLDPFGQRSATATCVVAYYDGADLISGRGEVTGSIAAAPRGSGGFGWDSVFVPEGNSRTFAEMSGEEKDRVSHRRRAWDSLASKLPELFGQK